MNKKIYIYIIILLGLSNFCYSQTYIFSKKRESVKYTNFQGEERFKTISTEKGKYRVLFHEAGGYKFFTLFENDNEGGWFRFLEKEDNMEIDGVIYSQSYYGPPKNLEAVLVYFAIDKSCMMIMSHDKLTEYTE